MLTCSVRLWNILWRNDPERAGITHHMMVSRFTSFDWLVVKKKIRFFILGSRIQAGDTPVKSRRTSRKFLLSFQTIWWMKLNPHGWSSNSFCFVRRASNIRPAPTFHERLWKNRPHIKYSNSRCRNNTQLSMSYSILLQRIGTTHTLMHILLACLYT